MDVARIGARDHSIAAVTSALRAAVRISERQAVFTAQSTRQAATVRAVPSAIPVRAAVTGQKAEVPAALANHLSIPTIMILKHTMTTTGMSMMITMMRMTDSWTMRTHGMTTD